MANITGGGSPWGMEVNPRTNMAYVSNKGFDTVSVIDGRTNRVVATVPVCSGPWSSTKPK